MTGPLGWFDPNLVLTTFFDEEEINRAWFAPEWVGVTFSDTITETGTAADTPSAITISADTEAASATDTTSSTVVFAGIVTEAALATDTEVGSTNYVSGISISEPAPATEIVDRSIGSAPLGWFDPNLVLATEFDDQDLSVSRTSFDPLWIGVTFSDSIVEQAIAAEIDLSTVVFVSSDSEAASASDAASSAINFAPTITETASATDTDTSTANFVSNATESASATDTADGPSNYVSGISETEAASATDTTAGPAAFVVTASEAGSTSDTVDANGNFIASSSELASSSDTITSQTDFLSGVSEAASASDTNDGPTDYVESVDEAASATDFTFVSIEVSIAEAATANDTTNSTTNFTCVVNEAAIAIATSDGTIVTHAIDVSIAEAATANDTTNGTTSFTCVVNEAAIAITTSDGTIVTHAIDVSIAELVTAADSSFAEAIPPIQIVINNSIPVPVAASTTVNTPITPFYLRTISSTFPPDLVTYTVTTAPAFGILLEDGMVFASNPIQFSQADLNGGRVSYQNTIPTTLDEFHFRVSQPAAFALQRIRFADSTGQSVSGSVQISVNARTIQIVGDKDTGDGLIETPSQDFYKVSGKLISVDTTAVTDHPPDHTNVKTANGASFFHINGKPVNFKTNADTCGHTRNGDEANWFNVG